MAENAADAWPKGTQIKVTSSSEDLYGETAWVIGHDGNYVICKTSSGQTDYIDARGSNFKKTFGQTKPPFKI